MADTTELQRQITSKLPSGALNMVCENAPEGTNENGESYKDLCHRCLDTDTTTENQKVCVAGVVADFVAKQQGGAAAAENPTELNAAGKCTNPNDPSCYM